MQNNKTNDASFAPDRMGRFIGQLRIHEGITLSQLSHGLCSVPFLNRIENGEREVGKQMTDAFFQRLGKPVELFERILDWEEFQQWSHRQEIIASMHHGDINATKSRIQNYLTADSDVLDQQFAKIVEINCCHLSGADPKDLLPMVCDALTLTQPDFQSTPIDNLLLSQNEGRLLFAYLQLKEQLDGFEAVSESYDALLRYFKKPRYESRERVYLVPYVACRVIEHNYNAGRYMIALTICEDTLTELTKEKRLFAYDRLLEWKQKLFDVIGHTDKTPEKLLTQLKLILSYAPKQAELLIPCDERGHVYCLNQVIRDRRRLLGISQEALAEDICEPRNLSRIETQGGSLHRKNRKLLLQRVNMSGERYDYEVITDRYEDYLLRSELDRSIMAGAYDKAEQLLDTLKQTTHEIPTNRQYLAKNEAQILEAHFAYRLKKPLSSDLITSKLEDAIRLTLPLDIQEIDSWPASILSINEILSLVTCAFYYKRRKMFEKNLSVLAYVKKCLINAGTDISFYEDLYTRVEVHIASTLGDIGHYQESNDLAHMCIQLSVDNQNSTRLPQYLYGIAWNLSQQNTDRKEDAVMFLKQAYAASLIAGDILNQKQIYQYCRKTYDVDPSF